MRLCHVADIASVHALRWVNHFAGKGHEVHLVSRQLGPGQVYLDSRVRVHNLVRLLPTSQVSPVSFGVSALPWLLQLRGIVGRIRPDIVHAHFAGVPGYLGALCGFHPFVLSIWGSDILLVPRRNPVVAALARYAVRRADLIVCVSDALRDAVVGMVAGGRTIHVTPVGVNTDLFKPLGKDVKLLSSLGWHGAPVAVSTRMFEPVYDVETLIRAWPLVVQKIPDAKLILAGAGSQSGVLEKLVSKLGVSESTHFVGMVPNTELPSLLSSGDVYVSTSLSDGTSISLLEALSCGLAPVVTDIPANRPWVIDGSGGSLFPAGDYQALAAKITTALKDKEMRTRFGEAGRRLVLEKADFQKEMAKIERLYEEIKGAGA